MKTVNFTMSSTSSFNGDLCPGCGKQSEITIKLCASDWKVVKNYLNKTMTWKVCEWCNKIDPSVTKINCSTVCTNFICDSCFRLKRTEKCFCNKCDKYCCPIHPKCYRC